MSEFFRIELFVCLGFLWIVIGTVVECLLAEKLGYEFIITPKYFYDSTKMNWFGSIFCFILIRFISPVITVGGLVLAIILYFCSLISWIFTVGKESEEE